MIRSAQGLFLSRKEQKRTQVPDANQRCLDATDSRKEVFKGLNERHEAHECRLGTGDVSSARNGGLSSSGGGHAHRTSKQAVQEGLTVGHLAVHDDCRAQ